MFFIHIQQNQWLFLGLGGGLILMLGIVLFYTAGWRPRGEEEVKSSYPATEPKGFFIWLLGTFPWILIVTLVAIAVWTFLYPVLKLRHPPNW